MQRGKKRKLRPLHTLDLRRFPHSVGQGDAIDNTKSTTFFFDVSLSAQLRCTARARPLAVKSKSQKDLMGKKGRTCAKEVVARLTAGNQAFVRSERYAQERAETAGSQHPHVIVVSCSDSRVSAPVVFDAMRLGFMFESKTAGQTMSSSDVESVRYAVKVLTPQPCAIVMLGHTDCGAVRAAVEAVLVGAREAAGMPVEEAGPQRVYPTIVANIAPAARAALAEADADTRHAAICGDADAVASIVDSASVINTRIRAAELRLLLAGPDDRVPILPAFYNVRTGRVRWL
ncbi:Pro CA domain containing protein [Pandoravirus celtis]|uniref:carbonic anhydrase n=1 Tax=Pandoravirus celtis TaxID=2568002 RepID=A0A4D6EJK2_9VIRU|nr:Pro CA domain containing protein [Pandoravirus celtis]